VSALLGAWNNFYVMIGSSAAALTGLMFVVITLSAREGSVPSEDGVSTFSTPNVVHFSTALLTAAVMTAPFRSWLPVAAMVALVGAGGLVHVGRVALRTSTMTSYRADAEDWIWHVVLPGIAYAALFAGALALESHPAGALFAPAAGITLLIFVGIHNAWDVVTFLATGKAQRENVDH